MEKINHLPYALVPGEYHKELPNASLYHLGSLPFRWGMATYEEAMVLYSLVLATKPELVVETGAETGFTTVHMALALRHNGRGRLITVEREPGKAALTRENIRACGLSDIATVVEADSHAAIDALTEPVGFALLDTLIEIRASEMERLVPHLAPGALVAVHDTSPLHPRTNGCDLRGELSGYPRHLHIETPRGLSVYQPVPAQFPAQHQAS